MSELSKPFLQAWQETALKGEMRSDFCAVIAFPTENEQDSSQKALELFWDVWQPRDRSGGEVSQLTNQQEEALLDELAFIEKRCRVPYQPDEDPSDDWEGISVYIHAAAAFAIRLKRRDGYSDDVRQALDNIRRSVKYIYAWLQYDPINVKPIDVTSILVVGGLALAELSHVKELDGDYKDSLHLLVSAADLLGDGLIETQRAEEIDRELGFCGYENYDYDYDFLWRSKISELIQEVSLRAQGAVDLFENLMAKERTERAQDWQEIAKDCTELSRSPFPFFGHFDDEDSSVEEHFIVDAKGQKRNWTEYWRVGEGRVLQSMEPDLMMEYVHRKEDVQAEERLTRYFFSEKVWRTLPDKTRTSLINADRTWFSTTVGRLDSTLNELRVAVETLLHPLFWEPLPDRHKTDCLNKFRTTYKRPVEQYNPTLGNYIILLGDENVLESIGLDGDFVKELRQGLKDLQPKRNPAEHDPKHSFTRSAIQGVVQKFLGIRQEGILPRLAKLHSKRVAGHSEGSE